jgi:hypothetical protein
MESWVVFLLKKSFTGKLVKNKTSLNLSYLIEI